MKTIADYDRQIYQAKEEAALLLESQKGIQKRLADKKREIDTLSAERERLQAAQPKTLKVTDHALLRYAERYCGFDRKKAEKHILDPKMIEQFQILGDGKYPVNGITVIVKGGVIKTVLKTIKTAS